MNRREFLASAAVVSALPFRAAKYDMVIKGGQVVDPSQRINRKADVAIRAGKIEAIQPNIAAADATEVLDASNRLVVPGLVDIHAHPRPGEVTPEQCLAGGSTTVCDGGSRGAANIQDMIDMAAKAPNRIRLLINV